MKRAKRHTPSFTENLWDMVRPRKSWIPYSILMIVLVGLSTFRINLSSDPVFEWQGWETNLGKAITIMLLVGLWGTYLKLRRPGLMSQKRIVFFLMGVIVAVAIVGRAADLLAPLLVPLDHTAYLVPVAFGAGLVTIFAGAEVGFSLVILLAFWVGIGGGIDPIRILEPLGTGFTEVLGSNINPMALFAALGSGAAAVFRCAQLRKLSDLPLAGLQIGLFGAFILLGAGLVYAENIGAFQAFSLSLVWTTLGGFVSVLLIFAGLPLAEFITQKTSPLGLVELLNPSNPLLTRLRREAPGTYHHSIGVADLAESAAQEIGADPLLTKVGGYYHDIGKLKRPEFFIENQGGGPNPHDEISPSMSKMILTSHIKEGIELAREYGLREDIVQFIGQHHGTSMIRYFYYKALKEGKTSEEYMSDFRYDTELPNSKETALVMLADSVQAASASLDDPANLEEMIHKVMRTPLEDNQLIKSPLTLKDLQNIEASFFSTLRAMRHDRSGSFPKEQEVKAIENNVEALETESETQDADPSEPQSP